MARSRRPRPHPPTATVEAGAGPIRTCIGCRRQGAPDTLVRIVASDDPPGYLVGRTLPGRGAWLCRSEGTPFPLDRCISDALRRKAFARAFRVKVPGRR